MSSLYLISITVVIALLSCFNLVNSQTSTTLTPPTTPLSCPGGGVAYQDIAILYELSYFPDNSSMQFSQQISNAIASKLFSGPAYQYYQADGITRATQITPIPFPGTSEYNWVADDNQYGKIASQKEFEFYLTDQLKHSQIGLLHHPTESRISEALNYLAAYIKGRRPFPIQNTVVIIAKRDSDVTNSLPYTNALNSTGSKVMTIGVGNGSLSNLQSLSSGPGYNFLIPDITDTVTVDNVAQQIATQLITDCGITWTPLPTTTPIPTTPYTGPSTTTTTSTSTTTMTTTTVSTVPTTPNTGTQSTTTTSIPGTGSTESPATTTTTAPPPTNVSTSLSPPPANTSTTTTTTSSTTSNPNTTTTTPATTTTTAGNQYREGASNMHSFSYFFLFLSFLYTFANLC